MKNSSEHARSIGMLEDFGLTQNEAKIYVYLLERGSDVGGSKIAIGTGLHRQYVYTAIKRLFELGLVEAVRRGKQSRYRAAAQTQIERIIRKRTRDAEELVRELNTFSRIGHEQDFEIYQGLKQLQDFEIAFAEKLSVGSTQHVIGGATDHFYHAMEDRYDAFVEIVKEKKLTTRYIGPEEELSAMKHAQKAHPGFIYRTIKHYPKGLQNTVIRDDSVAIYSFAKPVLVYVVKSPVVANNYKKFFSMLWNMAA